MKFILSVLFLSCLYTAAIAQQTDTIYLNKNRRRVAKSDSVTFVQYLTYYNPDKTAWTDKVFYVTGEKDFEGHYQKSEGKVIRHGTFRNWHKNGHLSAEYTYRQHNLEGKSTTWYANGQKSAEDVYVQNKKEGKGSTWYENGQLKSEFDYRNGLRQGQGLSYHPNGKLKRRERFDKGALLGGKSYTKTGADTVFVPSLSPPEYPGGLAALTQFISTRLVYPESARENGIEGVVQVQFVVDKNGFITRPEVVQRLSPETDAEALRIVKALAPFNPAKEDGVTTSYRFILPIRFALQD